jgi:hypothetical protein
MCEFVGFPTRNGFDHRSDVYSVALAAAAFSVRLAARSLLLLLLLEDDDDDDFLFSFAMSRWTCCCCCCFSPSFFWCFFFAPCAHPHTLYGRRAGLQQRFLGGGVRSSSKPESSSWPIPFVFSLHKKDYCHLSKIKSGRIMRALVLCWCSQAVAYETFFV